MKISDNPNVSEPSEGQILYTSLHHAREPESLTQLIYYMWYLLENYNTNPEIKYLVALMQALMYRNKFIWVFSKMSSSILQMILQCITMDGGHFKHLL